MSIKVRISKPGYPVTDPNLDHIVYDSDYDTLKYFASGSVNLEVSAGNAETSIDHNLGYIPFFVVFHNTPINVSRFSMTPFAFEDIGVYGYISAYADENKIYFTVHTNAFVATINFRFKIFRNDTGL